MHLTAAANTLVPAVLLIRQMGYALTIRNGSCLAEKDGSSFQADDPVTLLGLIKLIEMKGENWRASDEEIEQVLKEISQI